MARSAVKLAISLPKSRVTELRAAQAEEGKSLSAVVDAAVSDWLRRRERAAVERQYRDYYAAEPVRDRHRRLARQMAAAASIAWPED